jgi:hypothetical protein
MLYRITNLTDVNVMFSFPQGPAWNFWVEKDKENIWAAVTGWYAKSAIFTLAPGEYHEFPDGNPPYIWDMRDNENILINIGEYEVIGGFDAGEAENYYYSRVSVPITIVPEPSSLALLLGGIVYFTRRKREN